MQVKKVKNRLYNLPDDLITHILEYHDPYKRKYKKIIFDLKWFIWWHSIVKYWRPYTRSEFYVFILRVIRNMKKNRTKKLLCRHNH